MPHTSLSRSLRNNFSASYRKIAPDSKTRIGCGPLRSTSTVAILYIATGQYIRMETVAVISSDEALDPSP